MFAVTDDTHTHFKDLTGATDAGLSGTISWSELLARDSDEVAKEIAASAPPAAAKKDPVETVAIDNVTAWLETACRPLDRLVGMDKAKKQIASFLRVHYLNTLRERHGLKKVEVSANVVLTGNPGTGKTTLGRLLGPLLKSAHILTRGHVVEIAPTELFDSSMGTEIKRLQDKMAAARGGVLLINEAQNLTEHHGRNSNHGRNVTTLLLQEMLVAAKTPFATVLTGTKKGIDDLFVMEPGLKSRFQLFIHLDNYTDGQLAEIFRRKAEHTEFSLADGCDDLLASSLPRVPHRKAENFGNARYIDNLFAETVKAVADRVATVDNPDIGDISVITRFDVGNAFRAIGAPAKKPFDSAG